MYRSKYFFVYIQITITLGVFLPISVCILMLFNNKLLKAATLFSTKIKNWNCECNENKIIYISFYNNNQGK